MISGEAVDRLPWVPRLDLWHRANQRAGTLPPPYQHATLDEIIEDLGVGYHAVVPDFQNFHSRDDEADRGFGLYNLRSTPFRSMFENVTRTVKIRGDRTSVTYQTPHGSVRTTVLYDEGMRKAGITISHIEEYAFKDARDYPPLEYIFRNIRVEPNEEGYREFAERIGERGIAVGFVNGAASPMHLIQRELMPFEQFFFEMQDHPDELARLADAIGGYWEQILAVVSAATCEVVFWGGNYDATLTCPPFFAAHILPWLKAIAQTLHQNGKFLLCHPDGENSGLLPYYLESKMDIADSICPAPMTKLSFKEVRDCFGDRITIMGGIPSIALLSNSMSDSEFSGFLERFLDDLGDGRRLILGISDTTPPQADFRRILEIAGKVEGFKMNACIKQERI